jgi:epoxyqueuosine reductase
VKSCTQSIKQKALELGFDVVGITDASPIPSEHIDYLKRWLSAGCAGQMTYMHRNFEKRVNPALLLDGAKSVICVGLNYSRASNLSEGATNDGAMFGRIDTYACFDDYHLFIRQHLYLLADFIKSIAAKDCKFKVCVDSAPIAERSLAVRAGLGFIGKNRMLTNPTFGPRLFLGELITDLQLEPDKALTNDCSGCTECIKACPTGALTEDGLDARRCISYLTIEHKDVISQELTEKIGDRLFGCDQCILACPLSAKTPGSNGRLEFHKNRQSLDLRKVLAMDEEEFKKYFHNSPLLRLGLERLKRNAVICLLSSYKNKSKAAISPAKQDILD